MKTFIATYKIFEGEHDREEKLFILAEDKETAEKIAASQEHNPTIKNKDEKLSWWDYGDGSTGANYRGIEEIDPKEAEIIARHGLVHYYHK
jgi:hypothetical protein